jgi:hypothetical protein
MSKAGNAKKLSEPPAWFILYLNSLTEEKLKEREKKMIGSEGKAEGGATGKEKNYDHKYKTVQIGFWR